MILIFSDDNALAENLSELLQMEGLSEVVIRAGFTIPQEDVIAGIDLIIHHNRWDETGEKFEWYLLANQLQDTPVIFLTLKERQNKNPYHCHIELPFDLNTLAESVSDSLMMNKS